MNNKALHTLEYDKILERLEAHCTSETGKRRVLALRPDTDKGRIIAAQKETSAALTRIFKDGSFSFAGITFCTRRSF